MDRYYVCTATLLSAVISDHIYSLRCTQEQFCVCNTIIYTGGGGERQRPKRCLLNTLIAFGLCSVYESAACVVKIDCVSENKPQATHRCEIRALSIAIRLVAFGLRVDL